MSVAPSRAPSHALAWATGPEFVEILIFLAMATMLGAIIQGAAPKLLMRKVPQPVILMTVFVIGGVIFGNEGFSIGLVNTIDPLAIQALFLPPLMFAELFRMNIQNFRVVVWQLIWLVGPGVVLGTIIIAMFPYYLMPSQPHFSLFLSIAFGGMLSTTDPIAVIMTINELGAPKRLAAIVGGESLLNDGTSIVIVTLFLQLASGESINTGEVVFFTINNIILSVLFGVGCGVATLGLMRLMRDDGNTQTALTVASPYLTFAIATYYFDSSGVLALIPLGILLNRFARGLIRGGHLETMEEYWETLSFLATTWLYALTGYIVGVDFLSPEFTATDWGSLFFLYVWITLARLVMVVVSMPILYKMGYGFSLRESVVLWWGGLRGAVGLTLSISIRQNHTVPARDGLLTTFFMAGIVLIMLVNVITLPFLLRLLNLHQKPNEHVLAALRNKMFEKGFHALRAAGVSRKQALAIFKVEIDTSSASSTRLRSRRAFSTAGSRSIEVLEQDTDMFTHPFTNKWVSRKLLNDKRRGLLRNQMQTYNNLLARGLLSRAAWYLLILAVEKQIDSEESALDQWSVLVQRAITVVKGAFPCLRKQENTAGVLLAALAAGDLEADSVARRLYESRKRIAESESSRHHTADSTEEGPKVIPVSPDHQREYDRLCAKYASCVYDDRDFVRSRMVDMGLSYSRRGWVQNYSIAAWAFIVAQQRSKELIKQMFTMDRTSLAFEEEQDALRAEVDRTCRLPALFIEAVARHLPEVAVENKKNQAVSDVKNTLYAFIGTLNGDGLLERMELKRLTKLADKAIIKVHEVEFELKEPTGVGPEGKRLRECPNFYPFKPLGDDDLFREEEISPSMSMRRADRFSNGEQMTRWAERARAKGRRHSDSAFDPRTHSLVGVEELAVVQEAAVFDADMFDNDIDLKRF